MEITVKQVSNGWFIARGGQVWIARDRDEMLKIVKELSYDCD